MIKWLAWMKYDQTNVSLALLQSLQRDRRGNVEHEAGETLAVLVQQMLL